MTAGHFSDFAEAVARQQARPAPVTVSSYRRVTVLGGGADARMLAALALAEGAEVTLFSAYGAEMEALRAAGGITIRDAGPLGSYQIDREDAPSIKTPWSWIARSLVPRSFFLTGPIHKQRTYAMVLADHVRDGQVPGVSARPHLRCPRSRLAVTRRRRQGRCHHRRSHGLAVLVPSGRLAPASVNAARRPGRPGCPGRDTTERANVCSGGLRPFFPNLQSTIGTLPTSFADGSGLVEVLPSCLAARWSAMAARPCPWAAYRSRKTKVFAH